MLQLYNIYKKCNQCELSLKYSERFIGIQFSNNINTLIISDYLTSKENSLIYNILKYHDISLDNILVTTPVACHTEQEGVLPMMSLKTCKKINDILYINNNIKNIILLGNLSKNVFFGFNKSIKDGLYRTNNILYLISENLTQILKLQDKEKHLYEQMWKYYSIYQRY
jgi:hypothetical protein